MTLSDTDLEARLRRDLRARRADAAPPAPHDLAEATRRRHRTLRRREYRLAAGRGRRGAGPRRRPRRRLDLRRRLRPRARPPDPSTGQRARAPADEPTRGSLADDDEWLDGVLALDWVAPSPDRLPGHARTIDPPVDTRHVSFAQDVPDGRVALVIGQWDNRGCAPGSSGPEDAAPDEMELAAPPSETLGDAARGAPGRPGRRAGRGPTGRRRRPRQHGRGTWSRRDVDAERRGGRDLAGPCARRRHGVVSSLTGPPLDEFSAGGIRVHRRLGERHPAVLPELTERAVRLRCRRSTPPIPADS